MFPSPPWRARERETRLAHARSIVDEVVSRARRSKIRSPIMLSLESADLTDEQISAEILGLLIAGHHTTGATISWIAQHLALDPTISDMIALEADAMLDALEAGDAGALRRAPLSLAFVREILRLYPAGWWTSREVMGKVTIGGKTFRAG
ncbi:MAG: cytochrome P450, partial [bacterium]|nr:cytochrome P450 [bacterium]